MLEFGVILVCICPHFCAFRLNSERYRVSLPIQSECRKCGRNADQTNSEYGHFLRSVCVSNQRVKSVQIPSFFWSVFSCIRTEYKDLLCKSLYSLRTQENTEQNKLCIWTIFTQWTCCSSFTWMSAKERFYDILLPAYREHNLTTFSW